MDSFYKDYMTDQDKFYLAQVDNQRDFEKRLQNYKINKYQFLQEIKISREQIEPWKSIKNKKMLSGNDITMLSENQLIIEDGFAYDFGDIDFLIHYRINPFTKKSLSPTFISQLEQLKRDVRYDIKLYPLDQSLNGFINPQEWCPDHRFTTFQQGNRTSNVYMVSSQPVIRIEGRQHEVMLFYDKRPWNEKYIYLISLKQPIDIPRLSSFNSGFKPFGKIRDDMIQDLLLIHNPKLFSEPFKHNPKEPLTRDMIDGIWEFHNGGKRRIPATVIQKFKNGMYHEQFPMKLYRGLKMDNLQPLQVSLGDTIYLLLKKYLVGLQIFV